MNEYTTENTERRGLVVYLRVDDGKVVNEASVSSDSSWFVTMKYGDPNEGRRVLEQLPDGWTKVEELQSILESDPNWNRFEFQKPSDEWSRDGV